MLLEANFGKAWQADECRDGELVVIDRDLDMPTMREALFGCIHCFSSCLTPTLGFLMVTLLEMSAAYTGSIGMQRHCQRQARFAYAAESPC
jgi:hypothetical protein